MALTPPPSVTARLLDIVFFRYVKIIFHSGSTINASRSVHKLIGLINRKCNIARASDREVLIARHQRYFCKV
jgi:hypothetical protein